MASIERTAAGWRVRYREGGRGSPQLTSERFATKAEASAALRLISARLAARGTASTLMPWAELVERWVNGRPEGRYRESARKTLLALPFTDLRAITAPEVSALGVGARRLVKAVLRHGIELGQPIDPRTTTVRIPAPKARPRPLVDDSRISELLAGCAATCPGNGALAHLLATYGHRAENLVRLTAAAVNLAAGTLTLTVKGGDIVSHPLLPETVAILAPLVADAQARATKDDPSPPLFINHLDVPWRSGQDFAAWFHHRFGVGYYDAFKRPAISRMLGLGLDAKTVASITGHRTVSLLQNTYARTNEHRQQKAIAALALAGVPTVLPAKVISP